MQISRNGKRLHRTATQGDWCVSCTTGTGINGAVLSVSRHRIAERNLRWKQTMRGFGNGRVFPSTDAAWQFAFDHGYIALYFSPASFRAQSKARAFNPRAAVIAAGYKFEA